MRQRETIPGVMHYLSPTRPIWRDQEVSGKLAFTLVGLSGDPDWHQELHNTVYTQINEPDTMPQNILGGLTAQIDCGADTCVVDSALAKSVGLIDTGDTIPTNYGGAAISVAPLYWGHLCFVPQRIVFSGLFTSGPLREHYYGLDLIIGTPVLRHFSIRFLQHFDQIELSYIS